MFFLNNQKYVFTMEFLYFSILREKPETTTLSLYLEIEILFLIFFLKSKIKIIPKAYIK